MSEQLAMNWAAVPGLELPTHGLAVLQATNYGQAAKAEPKLSSGNTISNTEI